MTVRVVSYRKCFEEHIARLATDTPCRVVVDVPELGMSEALHETRMRVVVCLAVRFGHVHRVPEIRSVLVLTKSTETLARLRVLAAVETGRPVLGTGGVKVDELANRVVGWDTGVLAPLDIVIAYATL